MENVIHCLLFQDLLWSCFCRAQQSSKVKQKHKVRVEAVLVSWKVQWTLFVSAKMWPKINRKEPLKRTPMKKYYIIHEQIKKNWIIISKNGLMKKKICLNFFFLTKASVSWNQICKQLRIRQVCHHHTDICANVTTSSTAGFTLLSTNHQIPGSTLEDDK